VDICTITCRRPAGLTRLLGGIAQLRLPDPAPELRIVVVDNDAEESARRICADAAGWLPFPLAYATEKRRGIPQARNAALALSLRRADFVAFLDDDEVPDRDWLTELLRVRAVSGADAVAGPVERVFEAAVPRWVEDSQLFVMRRHPTGTPVATSHTGNVLISTSSLAAMEALFDERFALTGSSDSEFFERFAASGHRIVWCDSAWATEWVPASRARLRWLVQRALRVGASRTMIDRLRSPDAPSLTRTAMHGAWCVAKGAWLALTGLPRGRGAAVRGLYLACVGAGRLAGLLGWAPHEYRTIHGG
jgi:succinoglycan biosynthesis protein ExoM